MIYIDIPDLYRIGVQLNKTSDKLIAKNKDIKNEIIRIVATGANDIRNTIIQSMQNTQKAPWFYIKGKRGKKHHFPSAPGNPPAVDTGQLVRSIMWRMNSDRSVEVGAVGGTTGKNGKSYAVYLEKGTKRMEARPFLGPAVDKHIQGIIRKVEEYTENTMTVIGDTSK